MIRTAKIASDGYSAKHFINIERASEKTAVTLSWFKMCG